MDTYKKTLSIGAFFDFDQTLLDTESSRLGFKYLWERRLISMGFLAKVIVANYFYKRHWMSDEKIAAIMLKFYRKKRLEEFQQGAALYRRQMLDEIGLFDEDFFLVYEDVDLSFRAQLSGYKCIYAPDAIVYHKASSSIGDDSPTSVYYGHRNLEWVYIHNMPSSLVLKTLVPHIIYDAAAFFFFVARGRGADFIRAKWHALKGLKLALEKRQQVQINKKVSDEYIWSLFEKERLLPRLTRRISKNSS